MSLARDLARFVRDVRRDAGSAMAEQIMALSLYDWAACGMAGVTEPVAQILRQTQLVPQDSGSVVIGDARMTTAPVAALINGATSHALDYDDTHFAHIGHPSVAVIPAALAMNRAGAETLWAALIGAEVSVRVGEWLGRSHYQVGFHQTATAGAFGATAAAGLLQELSEAELEVAFGIAATQAAGLKSQFGTMGKPYHAGLAARTGVEAVQLAYAGFDARGAGLDGPLGFGDTHHGEGNLSAFDTLGKDWRMETVSHKFHACCHGLHAMLEALADVSVDPNDVSGVTVRTHPRWLTVCNIDDPKTGLETKFSFRHTAAMALLGRSTAALDQFTDALTHDPALVALRQSVRVVGDESLSEMQSHVVLDTASGQVDVSHDLNAPLALEDRTERLRNKAKALIGGEPETLLWRATNADRAPDMDALRDLLSCDA